MEASDAVIELIRRSEGCKLQAYPDPGTGGDPWTIGYGHTGPDVKRGVTWTQAQAEGALQHDIDSRAEMLSLVLKGVPTSQGEFDALLDFAFNAGMRNLQSSTLLRLHKAGNKAAAAEQFGKWVFANKKMLPGLVKRREAERKMYLGIAA